MKNLVALIEKIISIRLVPVRNRVFKSPEYYITYPNVLDHYNFLPYVLHNGIIDHIPLKCIG